MRPMLHMQLVKFRIQEWFMIAGKRDGFALAGLLGLGLLLLLVSALGGAAVAANSATPTLEAMNYLPVVQYLPTPTPSCGPPPIDSSDLANEAAILSGINERRGSNALAPLAAVPELTQSARRHSLDMAVAGFTSHTGSDGSTARDRMRDACYEPAWAGEIIGWGFGGNPESLLDWWMNSPAHKAMILSENFEDYGAGYIQLDESDWGYYWTVNFGRRAAAQVAGSAGWRVCRYIYEGEQGGSSLVMFSREPCVDYE
jgi:uncharacterized protein YkwD